METQIRSFYNSSQGVKLVTIFGYSTKGVPGLEINGAGKLSKNMKEKIIYLTRMRKLAIPLRRFVICVDLNELHDQSVHNLKWLEFPLLLMYWYLSGLIPIGKLENCLCSGWMKANGDIYQMHMPTNLNQILSKELNPIEKKSLRVISIPDLVDSQTQIIETSLLLAHIPKLSFRNDYIDNSSAIPAKCFMT